MNKNVISYCTCDIYLRLLHYCLLQFIVVLIHFNVPSIMVISRNHLVLIDFYYFGTPDDEYLFKINFLFSKLKSIEDNNIIDV